MKKIVSLLLVVVMVLTVVSTVSAKAFGSSINGPNVLHVGGKYRYTVTCTGTDIFYVEVGDISRIVSPKIISGGGTLHYVPETYPAWFGWHGDPISSWKATFFVRPDKPGTYRLWLSCYGVKETYQSQYVDITVLSQKINKR